MNPSRRLLIETIAAIGLFTLVGPTMAKGKHEHHSGKEMLGDKIKTKGDHVLHKRGPHTVIVHVADNGKIKGMSVKHDKKGDLAVKKYKTTKKMAETDGLRFASYILAQAQSMGTVYIGYAYIDDYGDEQIYWWPYEMIYDGDTGAVEYVPYA